MQVNPHGSFLTLEQRNALDAALAQKAVGRVICSNVLVSIMMQTLVHTHARGHTHTRTNTHTHTYTRACTGTHANEHTHVQTHVHTPHKHALAQTHTHTLQTCACGKTRDLQAITHKPCKDTHGAHCTFLNSQI